MMYHEFCKLTNTNTSYEQYITQIEPLYNKSELPKQEFCKVYTALQQPNIYTEFNPVKPVAIYKKDIKQSLKDWLEFWHNNEQDYLQDETFYIVYNDNTNKFISLYDYQGEKIRMQGIVNIVYQNAFVNTDFFYSDIMDYETFEFFYIMNILDLDGKKGKKYLVVSDMEKDYNKPVYN